MRKLVIGFALKLFFCASVVAQEQKPVVENRVQELKGIKDTVLVNDELNKLLKSDKEADWVTVYEYYQATKQYLRAGDFLVKASQKFPKGDLDYKKLTISTMLTNDEHKMDSLLQELLIKYPSRKVPALPVFILLETALKKKELTKAWYYTDLLKNSDMEGAYLGALMKVSAADPGQAETIVAKLYASALEDGQKLKRTANSENKGPINQIGYMYASVLLKSNKPEKAYNIIAPLYKQTSGSFFTNIYVQTLMATGRLKEAYPFIKNAVQAGEASDEMKMKFKDAYIAVNGSQEGFEVYRTKLADSLVASLKDELERKAISKPSSDFSLKDVDGKSVTLSDLKGKVVILDFWATWCGPCKASFPAMQKAINKYRNDPNVVFLFIHTSEKGEAVAATKEAKAYIVENKYTFSVLMDLKDPVTKQNKVRDQFMVSGIPTKIVIGPKGDMRFKVVGFNNSEEKTVDELSAMIEYAKSKS